MLSSHGTTTQLTTGVKRGLVNRALKQAAIDTGIPGADVSSHSLRATGLSRLLSAKPDSGNGPTGMQWEHVKQFGQWKSDCALRYFWASNELAREYAASYLLNDIYQCVK